MILFTGKVPVSISSLLAKYLIMTGAYHSDKSQILQVIMWTVLPLQEITDHWYGKTIGLGDILIKYIFVVSF